MSPTNLPRKPLVSAVRQAVTPVVLSLPLATLPLAAKAVVTPLGNEFIANETINGEQSTSQVGQAVAIAPDGDFVVVWEDEYSTDGDDDGVFMRIFNADGTPQTGEIQVNTTTTDDQSEPSVAVDDDGDIVVVWEGYIAGYYDDIFARTFNAAGAPTSGEILVNTTRGFDQANPSVAVDSDGDFAVAWQSYLQDGYEDGVFVRTFSAAGAPTSAEIPVNTTVVDSQEDPSIAMDDDGDFAVAWAAGGGQDGYDYGVFVRTFSAAGAPTSGEIQVNVDTVDTEDDPAIAMDADGDFAVAWAAGSDQDGDDYGIYYRTFSAAGAPTSMELRANQETDDSQARPSIAMQSDGDFVIVWNSYLQDGYDYGIYARQFNADGTPNGSEVRISQQAIGDQEDPSITVDDNGDGAIVFRSGDDGGARVGGDDEDIIARRFTLNAAPIEVPVNNPLALMGLATGVGLLGAQALRRRRKRKS